MYCLSYLATYECDVHMFVIINVTYLGKLLVCHLF